MIDITPYQLKLDYLKEWMYLRIDRQMSGQVVLQNRNVSFDFRNFDAFCRHKTGNYTNKALKYRDEIVAANYKGHN